MVMKKDFLFRNSLQPDTVVEMKEFLFDNAIQSLSAFQYKLNSIFQVLSIFLEFPTWLPEKKKIREKRIDEKEEIEVERYRRSQWISK